MRYYNIEKETGKIIGSYANLQPGRDLMLLDEPKFDYPKWNWKRKCWIVDEDAEKEAENLPIKQELINIDIASVRSIREWLVAQPGCLEWLQGHEKSAIEERAKLKK